jgi:hypothetical protein
MTHTHFKSPTVPEEVFGRRVTARLAPAENDLPHEISQRLKSARMLALSKRKVAVTEVAAATVNLGTTMAFQIGEVPMNLWRKFMATVPLVALILGLVSIEVLQDDLTATEVANVDAELLIDELPPEAYANPGFVQYLRVVDKE